MVQSILKRIQPSIIKNPHIISAVLLWVLTILIGYCTSVFIPIKADYGDGFPFEYEPISLWEYLRYHARVWDSLHFYRITETWYTPYYDHIGEKDYLYAYFPLLIVQARLLRIIFFDTGMSLLLISLVNVVLLALSLKHLLSKIKWYSFSYFLLILLIPFSVFFFLPYTESLYITLFLTIVSLIFLSNNSLKSFCLVFIFSVFLGLTRSVSAVYAIALAVYAVYLFIHNRRELMIRWQKYLLSIAGVTLGYVLFFIHNFYTSGNFFISRAVQDYWGRGSTLNPLEPVVRGIAETLNSRSISEGSFVFLFCCIVFGIVTWYKRKVLSHTPILQFFVVYSIIALIFPLTSDNLASINRYIIAIPVFLLLIPYVIHEKMLQTKKWIFWVTYAVLFAIFCLSVMLFTRHYWIG